MKNIMVAGSINMDVVARTENHPKPGETVLGSDLHFIPGGKGSNQAVAASRLGGRVSLLGKLGKDAFGEALHTFLRDEKLDLENLFFSDQAPTGTALIIVNKESENTIVVVPGSNSELRAGDLETVHFGSHAIVVSQFEIPQETVRQVFLKAKSAGATAILNPAPAAPFIPGLLEQVDYLVLNETELAFYAGSHAIPTDVSDLVNLATQLRTRSDQAIIITLGAKGLVGIYHEQVIEIAGIKVNAVDTTGAGDCFVGALAVALAEGKALESALRFANAAAALSVQRLGASASLPYQAEVAAFLDSLGVS